MRAAQLNGRVDFVHQLVVAQHRQRRVRAGTRTGTALADGSGWTNRLVADRAGLPRYEVEHLAGEEADDEARGGGDADPAAAAGRDGHGGIAGSRREAEDAGGLTNLRQTVENPRALRVDPRVVEDGVGFGKGRVAKAVGLGGERASASAQASQLATCIEGTLILPSSGAGVERHAQPVPAPSGDPLACDCLDRSLFVLPTPLAASESRETDAPGRSPGSCPSTR